VFGFDLEVRRRIKGLTFMVIGVMGLVFWFLVVRSSRLIFRMSSSDLTFKGQSRVSMVRVRSRAFGVRVLILRVSSDLKLGFRPERWHVGLMFRCVMYHERC
jgi:hypothetical protein